MKRSIKREIVGIFAIALVAFGAGRLIPFGAVTSQALAEPQDQSGADQPEMPGDWQAWVEAGIPGPHHEHLNRLVGEWEGEFTMWMEPGAPPMKSTGTAKREWIFGGRYLKEEINASSEMGEFEGISYVGYDNIDGVYKTIWMDSMSTGIYMETGMLDPETMILSMRGSYRNPTTGKIMWSEGELDMSNPDRQVYKGYMTDSNGKRYQSFKGVMTRVSE
jgi:hypothetical protein